MRQLLKPSQKGAKGDLFRFQVRKVLINQKHTWIAPQPLLKEVQLSTSTNQVIGCRHLTHQVRPQK